MQQIVTYEDGESPLVSFGRVADEQARLNSLTMYQQKLSSSTLRRHRADLTAFKNYLNKEAHVLVGDLFSDLREWDGITWGMVHGFQDWMIEQGYAMGSVDLRVVTVKKYIKLACDAGIISPEHVVKLLNMKGHDSKARRNIDEKRDITRIGKKKVQPTNFTPAHLQALRLKLVQDDTYIGRRDLLLLCLLGYHALRCVEIHDLELASVNMTESTIRFYRRKVDLTDNHEMGHITLMAMHHYLQIIPKQQGKLFLGMDRAEWTDKHGTYHKGSQADDGLSTDAIRVRVKQFGNMVGVSNLSPHDLRHACVDDLAKNGTPIELIKKFGGWKSYKMPEHYTKQVEITNKGIKQTQW
jgi:site-specific recombinase XerD